MGTTESEAGAPGGLFSPDASTTTAIGIALGQLLRGGDLVLLSGNLGAGKTTLTQGIAAGMGIDDYVTSPTFTLVNEYRQRDRRRPTLCHVDLYRIEGTAEASDLGLDEYLEAGVVVVEWAERALAALPAEHLLVRIAVLADDSRRIEFIGRGGRYAQMAETVANAPIGDLSLAARD